jgi:hypothetical protein
LANLFGNLWGKVIVARFWPKIPGAHLIDHQFAMAAEEANSAVLLRFSRVAEAVYCTTSRDVARVLFGIVRRIAD